MKKYALLIVLAGAVLVPLVFGQVTNCPDQVFLDPNTCPAELGPDDLVVDPNSGRVLYLGYLTQEMGKPWTWEGWSCTEEPNHVIMFTASEGDLQQNAYPETGLATYTLTGTVTQVGPQTIKITAHVVPQAGETYKTTAGGLVIIGTPRVLPAPPLCAGRPN